MDFETVLTFWFDELKPSQWWKKDFELDQLITEKFAHCHESATKGELFSWREMPEGRLAEIIVLDQFSRNIFRNDPRSFAFDGMALVLSQCAIDQQLDTKLSQTQRLFLYMPFMHSESMVIHEKAVLLFTDLGLAENLEFELKHKAIIDKYGRYPHRNEILGRASTRQELEFLEQPNSSF
ncbi:MAG: DUF924 domain-containing protein [Gammaproteobacteria bacterium]|nr:DUF924 domain-containing protein [Gammaproteobacteria bacterium]